MATVTFKNVNKIYDNKVQAVFDFNLEVADKEFIVLVGPSGCGKSTTLRMLAGLEEISSGEILIDDEVVNDVLPKNRNTAMVFQSYALYPHMTVYDNMAFALKIRNVPKDEINKKVMEAAETLALVPYLKRKPKELSGGQRQRVALGRSIVRTPKVFLMDEPLSNLDAKLRVQMRSEISKIHEKVGATTIYVTHDQTEAMTMADRIVIMKDGWIQQIGSPKEVYNFPHNMFVGGFIGSPAMNFIKGTCNGTEFIIKDEEDESNVVKVSLNDNFKDLLKDYSSQKIEELKAVIDEDKKWLEENEGQAGTLDKKNNEILAKNIETKKTAIENHEQQLKEFEAGEYPLVLGIRPEDVIVKEGGIATLKCDIAELLGKESIIYTYIAGQRLIIQTSADEEVPEGSTFSVSFNEKKMHFFDVESTARIRK